MANHVHENCTQIFLTECVLYNLSHSKVGALVI